MHAPPVQKDRRLFYPNEGPRQRDNGFLEALRGASRPAQRTSNSNLIKPELLVAARGVICVCLTSNVKLTILAGIIAYPS